MFFAAIFNLEIKSLAKLDGKTCYFIIIAKS